MKERRLCFISRTYYNQTSAGNKAKTDYEKVLHSMGAASIGLPCKIDKNKFLAFFYNLASTLIACSRIQKGDVIVLQYPVKKYFSFICNVAHLKGAKTISLIHDLGSFRRKKLTIEQELKRLSHTDYVIATNQAMKGWLEQQGFKKPIGALGFHDYLSPSIATDKKHKNNEAWDIVYAGSLNLRKNAFILKMQELDYQFKFHLYGNMEDYDAVAKDKNIVWHGFMNADDFIKQVHGNFGLGWRFLGRMPWRLRKLSEIQHPAQGILLPACRITYHRMERICHCSACGRNGGRIYHQLFERTSNTPQEYFYRKVFCNAD